MKELKDVTSYGEFIEWWSEYSQQLEGDRRTTEFKNQKSKTYDLMYKQWIKVRDERLSEQLHEIQISVDSDIASIKLMKEDNSSILLKTGSDGVSKYAIVENENDVPSYYELLPIVLSGSYKIMSYDCFKSFDDDGEVIEGKYISIYRKGSSYIFLKK